MQSPQKRVTSECLFLTPAILQPGLVMLISNLVLADISVRLPRKFSFILQNPTLTGLKCPKSAYFNFENIIITAQP